MDDVRAAYGVLKKGLELINGEDSEISSTMAEMDNSNSGEKIDDVKHESRDDGDYEISFDINLHQAQIKTVFDLQVLGSLKPQTTAIVYVSRFIKLRLSSLFES